MQIGTDKEKIRLMIWSVHPLVNLIRIHLQFRYSAIRDIPGLTVGDVFVDGQSVDLC